MKQSIGRSAVANKPLVEGGGEGRFVFPASFAQERLWFLDQFEPGSPVYNIPAALRLEGPLDVEALAGSLNEVVARHESLRTTFSAADGQPVQIVVPVMSISVPVEDLTGLPEGQREAEARRLAYEEARRPFDLATGPLLRAALLRLDERDHILLVTIHHIVSDGWSLGVFNRELGALYEVFSQGKPSPLGQLPIQYADFAIWQREWLQGDVLEAQLSYWREQLAGAPALLELPTDRRRPAVQSYGGAWESLMLSESLSESLTALSRQAGATLFMTMLAAFQVLLHRYTGQEDIIVGTPIANRNRSEIEGLIGFFVNTLVIRSDLSGDPTFRELLGQVREVCLGAYDHQDLPFERLVQELRPERTLSHAPVFQVIFSLQNAPRRELELPGLAVSRVGVGIGTSKFDLALLIEKTDEGLRAAFQYKRDLFDGATIRRIQGHYRTLLEGIVKDPDRRISCLSMLTEAERHQLLVEWNDTRADYPEHLCVHQLFEAQVERAPGSVAVVLEDKQLTYRELNCRANQVARYLRKLGVGPEVHVGICMERSLEMIVGLLGILKAGGAYVPLDPSYPKDRLAHMVNDVQASTILTSKGLEDRLPESGAKRVYLDSEWESIVRESEETPPNRTKPENLFSVMYTSGSSGRPKGVQITHRGVVNYACGAREALGWGPDDRGLQFAPISSDLSADEIFTCLTSGATLVLRTDEMLDSIPMFLKKCREWGITVTVLPTAFWHELTAQLAEENLAFPAPIRLVYFGGDRTLPDRLTTWQECVGDRARLVNGYGPSEATMVSTVCSLSEVAEPSATLREVPIGRPINNVCIHILDKHLTPVPIGVPGELHIGGVGVTRGYLSRPALTAGKFIPDPFGQEPGARLYKTGDLARYLADGNIEFLGRLDLQVKVRGFRIELGEIETMLARHPAVRQAVVLARENERGGSSARLVDKRLFAYIVPASETAVSVNELRQQLSETLPDYMIPSAFVMLDTLPLTPNRKVDRRALPALDWARPELEEAYVAPRTPVEEALARIWQEMLGLAQVGVHDDFFELGGHSLLATRVLSGVRSRLGVKLTLRDLFEAPTIAGLAASVEIIRWATRPPRDRAGGAAWQGEEVSL